MKLYHIIGLSTASLLSLGALGLMAQTEATPYNTDFRLETLSGNVTALNGIQLENITKTGPNQFSKVIITGENASLTPTKYDTFHGVGEDVLENRELYRHLTWPQTLENDNYLITANFNYSYLYTNTEPVLRIRSKNKDTGQINIQEVSLDQLLYGENIMTEFLTENNGKYYYIAKVYDQRGNKNDRILTYEIDPTTLKLSLKYEEELSEWSSMYVHNGVIYRNPNESNHLMITTLETNETKTYKMNGVDEYVYIENITTVNNELFFLIDSVIMKASFNDDNQEINLTPTQTPSFIESSTNEFESIYPQSLTENNDLVYTMYESYNTNSSTQYLSVLDPSTDKIIYEGKIMIRPDQGLVNNYQLKTVNQD